MEFWSAFILGLAGSLHCAVMCGPLMLAIPAAGRASAGRVMYHAGRIAVYAVLGALFGLMGRTFVLAGWQRALSLTAGLAIVLVLLVPASSRFILQQRTGGLVTWFKSLFASLLQRRTVSARFVLGGLNGLLPCGLVYVGAAVAAASGGPVRGAAIMLAFGAGTLPMLIGIGALKSVPAIGRRLQSNRVIFGCAIVAGLMLILRGLALGIPYVSPHLSACGTLSCCH
jgi:sulfite exporter TauE/SafE